MTASDLQPPRRRQRDPVRADAATCRKREEADGVAELAAQNAHLVEPRGRRIRDWSVTTKALVAADGQVTGLKGRPRRVERRQDDHARR